MRARAQQRGARAESTDTRARARARGEGSSVRARAKKDEKTTERSETIHPSNRTKRPKVLLLLIYGYLLISIDIPLIDERHIPSLHQKHH